MDQTKHPWLWLTCLTALFLVGAQPYFTKAEAPADVRDEGHFFTPGAAAQADEITRTIKQKYGKDLLIETFADIPEGKQERLHALGKDVFYTEWAIAEARKAHLNGIIILLVKRTSRLQVEVGKNTSRQAFTQDDRKELTSRMLRRFREKDYDRGLVEGADFVLGRLEKNLGPGEAIPPSPPPDVSAALPPAPSAEPTTNPAAEAPATRPASAAAAPAPTTAEAGRSADVEWNEGPVTRPVSAPAHPGP